MRSNAPVLLPILRSQLQADILTLVLLNPNQEYSLTELAKHTAAALSSIHTEIKRLTDAGIVHSRSIGRTRLVKAANGPLVEPLTKLIEITYGVITIIESEFNSISGIAELYIFGSWAARYHNVPGPEPHDIDVLVVAAPHAKPSRTKIYYAAEQVQKLLNKPVNPHLVSWQRWSAQASDDNLLQEIANRPLVQLQLSRFPHDVPSQGPSRE